MQILESSQRLVVTDRHWLTQGAALIFVVAGGAILAMGVPRPEVPTFLLAAIFLGAGAFLFLAIPRRTRWSFDRSSGELEITVWRWLRGPQIRLVQPLPDIRAVRLTEVRPSSKGRAWQIEAVLAGGEVLHLEEDYSALGRRHRAEVVSRIARFLGLGQAG